MYLNNYCLKYILSFLLIITFHNGISQTIQLNEQTSYGFKKDGWQYFKTDDSTLNIYNIIQYFQSGKFKPIETPVLNEGIPSSYYWIHFKLKNNEHPNRSLMLDIENPRLNRLELFEVDSGRAVSLGKLGDYNPFNQRTIRYKNFVYQTNLQAGQSKDYFLFVDQIGQTFALPIMIYSKKVFEENTYWNYLTDGLVYGVLFFVCLLTMFFFINTLHPLYIYYSLYLLTGILWFFSYFGLGYQFFWGDFPPMSTISAPLAATINLALNLQIAQNLLKLKKVNSFLNNLSNIFKGLLLLIGFLPVFLNLDRSSYTVNHVYFLTFLSIIIGTVIVLLYAIILYSIKGSLSARYYFIASILKVGNIFNLALLELGITPSFYFLEKSLQGGILIETTLLTYAIANRYTNYKLRTFNRVLEAQEEERSVIAKEIHDGVSSPLTGLKFAFSNILNEKQDTINSHREQIEVIAAELDKLQTETRYIAHNLLPDYIKNYTLVDIIKKYIREVDQRYQSEPMYKNFKLNFSSNNTTTRLNTLFKLQIFRITQELIANILKHSHATNADIVLIFKKKQLTIIAEDNGIGFGTMDINHGMGIKNIRSRVNLLNGNITIKNNTNSNGTYIHIKIPLRNLSFNLNNYDF